MPTIRELAGLPRIPAKLSESALILIDCQNTYREGVMQLEGVEDALQNASQLLIKASIKIGQMFRVQSHQMENGGVQVSDMMAVHNRFMAQFIGFPVRCPSPPPGTREPVGEALGIVIAASVSLEYRLTPKLTSPDHQGFVQ